MNHTDQGIDVEVGGHPEFGDGGLENDDDDDDDQDDAHDDDDGELIASPHCVPHIVCTT